MAFDLTPRQQRWLDAILILGFLALLFIVGGTVVGLFFYFGDVVLVFFLAWLLAFILSPLVDMIVARVPRLPRVLAVVLVYLALLSSVIVIVVLVAGALVNGILEFLGNIDSIRSDLPRILGPWQDLLNTIGLSQIDLVGQASIFLDNLGGYAQQLVGPLQQLAVASLGIFGNLLIIVILSVYILIDRETITSFLFRLVPPGRQEEARLLERSVSRSFGGFIRGQAIMGIVYAGIALVASLAGNVPLVAVTTVASGVLMTIPFFGPFVSWAPPVLAAIFQSPQSTLLVLAIMGVGWFFVMNILQPRLMMDTVGIHPIVVVGSVLVGSRAAGIGGAIFGIPIAAVISAFFFHFLRQTTDSGPVAARAARLVEARVGRPVRMPREPSPGVDPDVDDVPASAATAPGTTPLPDAGPNVSMAHPERPPQTGDA